MVDINGSKVFVENGEVKTILCEEIQRTGYITVEEARTLTIEEINKIYEMNNGHKAEKWPIRLID